MDDRKVTGIYLDQLFERLNKITDSHELFIMIRGIVLFKNLTAEDLMYHFIELGMHKTDLCEKEEELIEINDKLQSQVKRLKASVKKAPAETKK